MCHAYCIMARRGISDVTRELHLKTSIFVHTFFYVVYMKEHGGHKIQPIHHTGQKRTNSVIGRMNFNLRNFITFQTCQFFSWHQQGGDVLCFQRPTSLSWFCASLFHISNLFAKDESLTKYIAFMVIFNHCFFVVK